MSDQDHIHVGWSINDDLPALVAHLEREHPDVEIPWPDTGDAPDRTTLLRDLLAATHRREHGSGGG